MRQLWKPSDKMISTYPCIELRTGDDVEYGLSGPKGEIWEEGAGGRYRAIVTHGPSGRRLSEERLVRFGECDLSYWVTVIGAPSSPKDQTPWANTFDRRNR